MEWYEILISAVATLGGVGGFASIYKAKPEKTSIEVQNMKEMLNESHRMYDEMKAEKEEGQEEFKTFKETSNKYIAEFKERFAKLEERLDAAEDAVFHLKGAIYQGYRCKFPTKIEDCPVIKEYEKNHCDECRGSANNDK